MDSPLQLIGLINILSFLKVSAQPSSNADNNYQKMMELRDLTNRVVLEKFIFLNK